ncbi:MAG TPA: hypothetical protein PLQ16_11640, partial [Bacteroidia bacterium]|nr:hypothetical protein [Bacteroidia bacterium]
FWVSTMPYQEGMYLHYNLADVFKGNIRNTDSLNIPADDFVNSADLKKFEAFKEVKQRIYRHNTFGVSLKLSSAEIKEYIKNNPMSYVTYMSLGDYFYHEKNYTMAEVYYQEALTKEIASKAEEEKIKQAITTCQQKAAK